MSSKMVNAVKTLLVVVPLAIGIMAFQNCAPANFKSSVASSKGEATFVDNVDVLPIGDSVLTGSAPAVTTGDSQTTTTSTLPKMPVVTTELPVLLPSTTGANLVANCKSLRNKFLVDHALPMTTADFKTIGQSIVGPVFIHSASTAESVGGSALYLIGDNAEALVGSVSVKGNGHIVLCGLNAQMASTVGLSILDVVGGSIIDGSKSVGKSKINLYTIDGVLK